jgi:hypothetical protein
VWYFWYFILLSYIIHAVQQRNICKSRCFLVDTRQQFKFCLGMKLLPRVNISHFHDPKQHFLVMPPATKCASASLLTIQPVTCIHHHVRMMYDSKMKYQKYHTVGTVLKSNRKKPHCRNSYEII